MKRKAKSKPNVVAQICNANTQEVETRDILEFNASFRYVVNLCSALTHPDPVLKPTKDPKACL